MNAFRKLIGLVALILFGLSAGIRPGAARTEPDSARALAVPQAAAALRLPSPNKHMPVAELQAARAYAASYLTTLNARTATFLSNVTLHQTRGYYGQTSAEVIQARVENVQSQLVQALDAYIKKIDAILPEGTAQARAAAVMTPQRSAFGPPLVSLPKLGETAALEAARAELGEIEAYDNLCLSMVGTPQAGAKANLTTKTMRSLTRTFKKDLTKVKSQAKIVDRRRFSSKGLAKWKAADVQPLVAGQTYSGTSHDITEGFDMQLGVDLKVTPAGGSASKGNFEITFKEMSGEFTVVECHYAGTGKLGTGVRFRTRDPVHPEQCGLPSIDIDARGKLEGKVSGFPEASGDYVYWTLKEIQMSGLVKPDGTAEISSKTVYDSTYEGPGMYHNETTFGASQ
jgi:hypothetical protein